MWITVDKIIKNSIKNNKLILESQQRFRSENHNVFIEEVNRLIDSIETYSYGTSKDLVCKKEEIKCNNMKQQYKND